MSFSGAPYSVMLSMEKPVGECCVVGGDSHFQGYHVTSKAPNNHGDLDLVI